MKILHIIPSANWAGTEKIAFSFANYQSQFHEVVIVIRTGNGFDRSFYQKKINEGIELLEIPSSIKSQAEINRYVARNLKFSPDIIHGHLGLGCKIASFLKTPDNICIGHLHIRFFAIHFQDMDAVVAVSPWQLRDIPEWYRGEKYLVWNFLPKEEDATHVEMSRFKKRYYISNNDYVIGTVARLHIEKGIDTLIRAFIEAGIPDAKLVIIGDGSHDDYLRELAEGRDDIVFTGFVDSASKYMKLFDLYVSASRADSFGLSVLEALSRDVPVIASATYGSKDILGNSDNIFDIGDYRGLSCKMKKASINGLRQNVDLTRFSEDNSNYELLNFYEYMIEKLRASFPTDVGVLEETACNID
ncbi:glycosyltransferase [Comamonas testosteroni]|uniref:glycosyltransferase n=1 Tax=Comamonas testosteroni TaxID=285 RepID=UPI002DB63C31|nr:glycosyltransferase [Comamonas testosteroni]MEB5967045.1 glycosyltransferase [Comamonas testosteroni]